MYRAHHDHQHYFRQKLILFAFIQSIRNTSYNNHFKHHINILSIPSLISFELPLFLMLLFLNLCIYMNKFSNICFLMFPSTSSYNTLPDLITVLLAPIQSVKSLTNITMCKLLVSRLDRLSNFSKIMFLFPIFVLPQLSRVFQDFRHYL